MSKYLKPKCPICGTDLVLYRQYNADSTTPILENGNLGKESKPELISGSTCDDSLSCPEHLQIIGIAYDEKGRFIIKEVK